MNQKLQYTLAGCTLSLCNLALIGTRFNIVGLGFGLLAMILLIKAIRIKP